MIFRGCWLWSVGVFRFFTVLEIGKIFLRCLRQSCRAASEMSCYVKTVVVESCAKCMAIRGGCQGIAMISEASAHISRFLKGIGMELAHYVQCEFRRKRVGFYMELTLTWELGLVLFFRVAVFSILEVRRGYRDSPSTRIVLPNPNFSQC